MAEEKKIYTSFHDIPPREYMYFPKGTLDPGKPGRFSGVEIAHLLISMGVLTIAFSFALTNNNIFFGEFECFYSNSFFNSTRCNLSHSIIEVRILEYDNHQFNL